VCQRHYAKETNEESYRSDAKGEGTGGNRHARQRRREEQSTAPPEWAELRYESKSAIRVTYDYAREERHPDANPIAVVDYDVVKALELSPQRNQVWIDGSHLSGCHLSQLLRER